MSWDLGDEANPEIDEGCSEFGVLGLHGRKVGKLLRKNMRMKPRLRGREDRKVTNRPRAVGVPVSFAFAAGFSRAKVHDVFAS